MTTNELTLKLDRARWYVLQNNPFYGSLAMGLTDVIGNPHGKTACVDGKRIFWDPAFLEKLSDDETRFVLLHETLHCAHGHLWRFPAGQGDHNTANQACDHAINLTLNGAGLQIAMPAGGLADKQFAGMAEEEIYAALSQKPESQDGDKPESGAGSGGQDDGSGQGESQDDQAGQNGPGAGQGDQDGAGDPCGDYCQPADDAKDGAGDSQGAKPDLRESWEQKVIQAAQAAKASGQGDIPADMARELAKLAAVKIDWRQETADFIKNAIASRNDWTRGNRRHLWQSVVYPTRRRDNCGLILALRDTSGSITIDLMSQFSSILSSACYELGAELLLIDCDAAIQAEYRIEAGGEIPLTAKGGGGTDFRCIENRIKELIDLGENISGIIVLTDLIGSQFNAGDIASLWLCTTDIQSTCGKTVKIEI